MFSLFYFLIMNLTSNPQFRDFTRSASLRKGIQSARIMSLTKTKKWLNWLIDTNRVITYDETYFFNNESSKIALKNTVSIMIDCMTRRYGDNWDVHIESIGSSNFAIQFFTIFPETIITNDTGLSHAIKDLVVVFPIKHYNDKVSTSRVYGTRINMFRKEYDASYCHSHLSTILSPILRDSPFEAMPFCVGNGDLSFLETVLSNDFNARDFEAFLYELDATVRWESLSGNPYVYLRDLVSAKRAKIALRSHYEDVFINYVVNFPLDFNFYVSSNKYKIKKDHVFDAFVQKLIETDNELNEVKQNVLCTYSAATKSYYKAGSSVVNQPGIPTKTYGSFPTKEEAYLVYNGEKKYFSIRANPTSTVQVTEETLIIHPTFLEHVHTKLESLINEKVTRCSAISKYYSAEYQPTSLAQDTVLV